MVDKEYVQVFKDVSREFSPSRSVILSSPDRDYINVRGETRTYLDGICKEVQKNIPGSTISPITNLVWRVARGSTVLLEVRAVVNGNIPRFEYSYLDGQGLSHGGVFNCKSDLKYLIQRVGK